MRTDACTYVYIHGHEREKNRVPVHVLVGVRVLYLYFYEYLYTQECIGVFFTYLIGGDVPTGYPVDMYKPCRCMCTLHRTGRCKIK